MSIRFARKADCAAIAEIYNHAVLYTAAIWNDQTVDADNRIAWFEARWSARPGRRKPHTASRNWRWDGTR